MISNFDEAPVWKPFKQYLDGIVIAKDDAATTMFETCKGIPYWDQLNLYSHLISPSGGMPDALQQEWKSMIRVAIIRSSTVKPLLTLNLAEIIAKIPSGEPDPQRFCDFYFAVVDNVKDVESLAMRASALASVIWVVFSELSRQLKLEEFSNNRYPRTLQLLQGRFKRPDLLELIAGLVPQIVWFDPISGENLKKTGKGYSLLASLVHVGKYRTAYILMRNCPGLDCPYYDLDLFGWETECEDFAQVAYILSHCSFYSQVHDPKTKVFSGDYRPLETAIFNKCVKGFDKLFSSKRDLPNEVMVGVWLFLMHARSPVTKEVYAYFAEWEPQRVKILQRASAEVLTLLRDSMDVKIITAYLSLMAAHNNWDGFLGSAVYLQKQKYPAKDIGSCLNIAVMIAFYKMGSPDKAKKAADRELYTGPYFTLL
jgi:hypothetical protein